LAAALAVVGTMPSLAAEADPADPADPVDLSLVTEADSAEADSAEADSAEAIDVETITLDATEAIATQDVGETPVTTDRAGQTHSLTVTTDDPNESWYAENDSSDWLAMSYNSGVGTAIFPVRSLINTSGATRVGTITVYFSGVAAWRFVFTQAPQLATYVYWFPTRSAEIRTENWDIGYYDWTATSDVPWVTVSPSSAYGPVYFQVSIARNDGHPRVGHVDLTLNGGLWRRFFINQDGPGWDPVVFGNVTVTGTGVVGQTLTATVAGEPDPWHAEYAYQWFRGTSTISGATDATYQLQAADAGKDIVVKVTASAEGADSAVKYSNHIQVLGINKAVIEGTAEVGETLSLDLAYLPASVTPSIQWFRNTSPIAGANGLTYTLAAADAAQDISVKISAAVAGFPAVVKYSNHLRVSGIIGVNVTGTPAVGNALGSSITYYRATSSGVLHYQWYRGTTAISGATRGLYTLVAADAGRDLVLKVWMTEGSYTSPVKYSNHVELLGITQAVLSGQPTVGSTLTLAVAYLPANASLTYVWYRGTSVISGASGTSYRLTQADKGQDIVVKVTASQGNLTPQVKYSNHIVVP
jgi:hypothetical protein